MAQRTLEKQTRGQLSALAIMFLVGMALTFVGLPSEHTGSLKYISTILLALHVLIGFGLLFGAFMIQALSSKTNASSLVLARWGTVTVVLTFASGMATMATENNWWSYAMAVGFIASFLVYGKLLLSTNRAKH